MAVRVWERMMTEKAPGWRPPETPAEVEMPHVKGVTSNVVSEMNTEAEAMALWNDQEGKEERENRVEGKDRQDDREKDEFTDLKHLNQFTSSHDTTPPIVVVSGGARKSDGSSVYKLPITLTEFMKELKDDLGVRWDEHARETSIRFFKQARNLFGRAPRYDQLDLNDFEEEKYARKMAARRIEDKVVWSHRDNIRAEEFRQQAYESSLDSLGLKILNRRMRRDYAERQRLQKTKEAHELNEKMRNEMIKQEERAEKLRREREEKRVREKEVLRQQVLERLNKYPVKEKKNRLVGYVVSLNDVEEVDSLEMLGGTGSSHVEEGRGERRWGGEEGEEEEEEEEAEERNHSNAWYGDLTEKSREEIMREEREEREEREAATMVSTEEEVVEEDDDDILDQDDLRRMRQKYQYRNEKHFDDRDDGF
jgi:hypothetical protein